MADIRQQEELCLVCGDRASGYHYNALTCEGCKGFFRRSITKNNQYTCKYGNNCEIDMYMRRKCQECRLKKCLHVGMRPECVVPEYQCAIKRESKRAQKDKPNSTTKDHATTTTTTTTLMNNINSNINITNKNNNSNNNNSSSNSTNGVQHASNNHNNTHQHQLQVCITNQNNSNNNMHMHNPPPFTPIAPITPFNTAPTTTTTSATHHILIQQHQPPHQPQHQQPHQPQQHPQHHHQRQPYMHHHQESTTSRSSSSCDDKIISPTPTAIIPSPHPYHIYTTPRFLTQDQLAMIKHLVHYQAEYESPSQDELNKLPAYNKNEDEQINQFRQVTEMTILTVQLIVEFSKRVKGFEQLTREDQITLLKACASEVMMLRSSRKYDIKTDSILFANNQPFTRANYRSAYIGEIADAMFNFCKSIYILRLDESEYALLTALTIFSDRPNLRDPKRVEAIQDYYLSLLQAYVESHREPGQCYFARMLSILTELRALGIVNSDVCFSLKVKNKRLPDFLAEIWDVQD